MARPSIAAEDGIAPCLQGVRAGKRARASRHRDMPSGEPGFGEKHREPATAGADSGTAFLWGLSCRDKKVPRFRVREPDSNTRAKPARLKRLPLSLTLSR